jgi:hypothetical protein
MKHLVASALCAAVFFTVLVATNSIGLLLAAAAIVIVISAVYNITYLWRNPFFYWSVLRFALLQISIFLLALVSPSALKVIILLACSLLAYFAQLTITAVSEQMLFLETLFTFFGFSMAIYAASFYFAPKSTEVLLAVFLSTALICRSSFDFIPRPSWEKSLYSILIGLCVAEIGWSLLLLPFHFTALGIIAFNAFYVIWILTYYHLYNNISSKKIGFHLLFSAVLIIAVLVVTPWK